MRFSALKRHTVALRRCAAARPFVAGRWLSTAPQSFDFQAETKQLLDIVTHSLYTDREVFLRELVSNASDALEKLKHRQNAGDAIAQPDLPLEIQIDVDDANNALILQDTGIGMTSEELQLNLGTIARSGSKDFVRAAENGADAAQNIIGQFGVGFYAAFMVAEEVTVETQSADPSQAPQLWRSSGEGSFTVEELPRKEGDAAVKRGCKVTMKLKEDAKEFAKKARVEDIVRRYSNFVNYPITVNGEKVNTVQALWTQAEKDITEEQYTDFYRYIAGAFDSPMERLHFRADAPIDIKAILFVPGHHSEKFGMGRMEKGVSVYSRKVLIEHRSEDIVPDWLRFLRGVVDSEDLPLSVSREKAQDSRLMAKIREVLTKRVIRHFASIKKQDAEEYRKFWEEYSVFIKEGVVSDFVHREQLSKLLLFESSKGEPGELISLDDYVARCPPEQKDIYYLFAPTRDLAEQSPYFEAFRKSDREVLFLYNNIDDVVLTNLNQYNSRKLVTADAANLDLEDTDEAASEKEDGEAEKDGRDEPGGGLSKEEIEQICDWFKTTALQGKVSEVKATDRLQSSPAIVTTDQESGAFKQMMRLVDQQRSGKAIPLPPQRLELNSKHEIIVGLMKLKDENAEVAQLVAEQIFDNALIAAGLMDDSRAMVPRLNQLLKKVV
mmetsp:Transcript_17994/g.68202  ORF Transcript_17994/g.68202 Transcript_17994/m.68202 type:complete len:666 (-) Transcript_17994:1928-3925(-)